MENAARPLAEAQPGADSGSGPYGLKHVAIIMDGNGRWAQKRGLPRTLGHHAGVEALRRVVRHAGDIGLPFLTIYSFSSENWSRPASEVADLMGLLKRFIRNDLADLHSRNVRVRIIGERGSLAPDIRGLLDEAERMTERNTALTLVVAFNYGARQELAAAAQALAAEAVAGRIAPQEITPEAISARLLTVGIPDPDLIIRTSGEQRLSNFLLWQAAYTEFVFTPTLWPDFDGRALDEALRDYAGRTRRFGGL
ncbi:MAG TPA: isoprenyl transferase [Beijerinckiaceae bacterium]|nr:isoprenyl transferase [Beijerinckiaceae bacterium]